jgi:hypothetical protein
MKKIETKRLIMITLSLLVTSLVIGVILFLFDDSGSEHLDGTYVAPKSAELISAVAKGLIISMPIFCLVLGAITAIFIERDTPYRKRYVRGYLFTLAGTYLIYSLMGVLRLAGSLIF